jgi:NAD(P)-dependent dehydrogenase (short-subunit alcohol dehydrogenase family)
MSGLFSASGKVACVTGASSGLGRRAATVLAQRGRACRRRGPPGR